MVGRGQAARGFSLLASYGATTGSDVSTGTGYLGARYYGVPFGAGMLNLHAGRRVVYGTVGVPGWQLAGARPVPFRDGSTEIKIAFRLN